MSGTGVVAKIPMSLILELFIRGTQFQYDGSGKGWKGEKPYHTLCQ